MIVKDLKTTLFVKLPNYLQLYKRFQLNTNPLNLQSLLPKNQLKLHKYEVSTLLLILQTPSNYLYSIKPSNTLHQKFNHKDSL
jgi:hypothetical protein